MFLLGVLFLLGVPEIVILIVLGAFAVRWWKNRERRGRPMDAGHILAVMGVVVLLLLLSVGFWRMASVPSPVGDARWLHGAQHVDSRPTPGLLLIAAAGVIGLTWVVVLAIKHRSLAVLLFIGLGVLSVFGFYLSLAHEQTVTRARLVEQQQAMQADSGERRILNEITDVPGSVDGDKPQLQKEGSLTEPTSVIEVIHSPARNDFAERQLSELPDWAQTPSITRNGGNVDLVLASERFATLEEAKIQLWPQLLGELTRYQAEEYPEMQGWTPTIQQTLASGILNRECRATYPLEVGGFTEDVHQIFWDVQFNPQSRDRLYADWRPGEVRQRLAYLGSALGAITLALGAGAFALRRRQCMLPEK